MATIKIFCCILFLLLTHITTVGDVLAEHQKFLLMVQVIYCDSLLHFTEPKKSQIEGFYPRSKRINGFYMLL